MGVGVWRVRGYGLAWSEGAMVMEETAGWPAHVRHRPQAGGMRVALAVVAVAAVCAVVAITSFQVSFLCRLSVQIHSDHSRLDIL